MNRLTKPKEEEPISHRRSSAVVNKEVKSKEEEWESCAVVTPTFGSEEMSDVRRDVLVCPFSTDDGSSKDGIGWGETCGYGEAWNEVQARDEGVNEARRDEPSLYMILVLAPRRGEFYDGGSKKHTHVITGANKKRRLRQCLAMYALGSSTPMANTPMASTTRVNSKVMTLVTSSECSVLHERGSKMPAQ